MDPVVARGTPLDIAEAYDQEMVPIKIMARIHGKEWNSTPLLSAREIKRHGKFRPNKSWMTLNVALSNMNLQMLWEDLQLPGGPPHYYITELYCEKVFELSKRV